MRILIAAGGTGGHIYPALAATSQLATRQPDLELRWIGGHRGLEGDLVPGAGLPLERLWLRSLRTVDVSLDTLLDPLRLLASLPQAAWKLLRWRPDAIYTTGGYVAIPVLAAAALLRIPSLLWEGNQVPGRSVRLIARLASVRAVSFAGTRDRLPPPTYLTGTPIRTIDAHGSRGGRASGWASRPACPSCSSSVARSRCVAWTRPWPPPWAISSSGAWSCTSPAQARSPGRPRCATHCRPSAASATGPSPFLHEDMAAALSAADLLVGRAGSSHAGRGDRGRPAHGRGALPARGGAPARQRRGARGGRWRAAGG